jgi:hypothetical protein
MKKLFITALVLGIGFTGFSQDKGSKTTTKPDTTANTKANYNTTRSNKKGIAPPKKTNVNTTIKPASGGQAIKPNFQTILERKKMK